MKFHQVPLGQRFEFEGKWYIKNRPLTAIHEASGESRMIRRSANVKLQGDRVAAAKVSQTLETEAVRAAFESFHARCLSCLQDLETAQPGESLSVVREAIERARREFMKTLCI